jgi:class 3 adenylate cyclase
VRVVYARPDKLVDATDEVRGAPQASVAVKRRGISISRMLSLSLGALIVITVVSVLTISLYSGISSTLGILERQALLVVDNAATRVEDHLSPATHQLSYIHDLIATGQLDPSDSVELKAFLTGAVAGVPQVGGLVFVDPNLRLRGIYRIGGGAFWAEEDQSDMPMFRDIIEKSRDEYGAKWGGLLWSDVNYVAVLTVGQAVRINDEYVGTLGAGVSVARLSNFVAQIESGFSGKVFILSGREDVLAHPNLMESFPGLTAENPLPTIHNIGDPVLAQIWQENGEHIEHDQASARPDVSSRRVEVNGENWFFTYRTIHRYGEEPWLIGSYFRGSEVEEEFSRLKWAAFAGLLVLLLGIIAAILLGRRISKPVRRLAVSAQRIGAFEFDRVETLDGGSLRELNEAASAFNLMLRGLRWFESYVPRKLARQLMVVDSGVGLVSEERQVTVMFTDIAGFTRLAENWPAADTAKFLNEHFDLVTAEVEAEGGTVDKYIGDAVMAFWGAPEHQDDHALRACRAAKAIAEKMEIYNGHRRAAGLAPVTLRIGIHTGVAIVGNIGAPDRINYTIVGDTVNTCQRIEQLGKTFSDSGSEVSIIISATTAQAVGGALTNTPLGKQEIRGREGGIEIFRLD